METESSNDFSQKTWKEDLALVVDGEQLHVAKNVLAYLSPVFEAMFSQPFMEKDKKELELPGKEYESFVEFLRCFYPGKHAKVTEKNIFEVLPLADEYQVEELIGKCELFLRGYVKENVRSLQDILKCLALANRYQMNVVKNICVQRIESKSPSEVADAEIDPVCSDTVFEIMKRMLKRQEVQRVKMLIKEGLESNFGSEFIAFTNAIGTVFELTVENVNRRRTTETAVANIWGIQFSVITRYTRRQDDGKVCLAVFLKAKPPVDIAKWSCRVKGCFILRSILAEDLKRPIDGVLTSEEPSWGYQCFEELDEVNNVVNGYNVNEKVQIDVAFLTNKPDMRYKAGQ